MLAAIIVCGLGYAEGSRLAKRLGSWQIICLGPGDLAPGQPAGDARHAAR